MYEFDLFVIGAGSGGVRAARMAAEYGARAAIAEEHYLGGTCVNVGCIPKKLYSYASQYRYDFEDSAGFGWQQSDPVFDWSLLRDNKKQEISRLNTIYDNLLQKAGVKIYQGRATIKDSHTVEIKGQVLSVRHIVLATGGWPHVPEFPGRELVQTSNEIFDLDSFPSRILIVGGGYIAVEFAGIFAGLGAETLLSYRGDMPLKGFDEDLRKRFCKEAGKHLQMLMESDVEEVSRDANGSLVVRMRGGDSHTVDAVLYATGRKPNTRALGLENVGVKLDEDGRIIVDDCFQTNVPSIHALGDVVGKMALTPVALAEGMFLAKHLFGKEARPLSYDNIATSVFSHPNLATVGLPEDKALASYGNLTIFESDFRSLRHTLSGRDERNYMKVIVDTASDRVVGMHMLGPDAGEVVQGFAAAMTCGMTKAQLDATIGIHPTTAEEFVTMRNPARSVRGKKA